MLLNQVASMLLNQVIPGWLGPRRKRGGRIVYTQITPLHLIHLMQTAFYMYFTPLLNVWIDLDFTSFFLCNFLMLNLNEHF